MKDNAMTLEIPRNTNPVLITAYINGSGNLSFRYNTTELEPYNNHVLARHTSDPITFQLPHFEGWQLSAYHQDEGTVTWTVGTAHVSYEFHNPTTEALDVIVVANHPTSGSQSKTILIEAKPKGSLPDRP